MSTVVSAHGYNVELEAIYERMWFAAADLADGTRVYVSHGATALKWLIADLSGTPAESGKTLPANNALRAQVHAALTDLGWADRLNERSFRLLVAPEMVDGEATQDLDPLSDPDDEGSPVEHVGSAHWATSQQGRAGLDWSRWTSLAEAARTATTRPGIYLARTDDVVVYVGMAGDRRGRGVRGRLSVYARGRGAVSGLGEAVLDRALADERWLAERVSDLRRNGPTRTKEWAVAAFDRLPLEVAWVGLDSTEDAKDAERSILLDLSDSDDLWNRARPRPVSRRPDR